MPLRVVSLRLNDLTTFPLTGHCHCLTRLGSEGLGFVAITVGFVGDVITGALITTGVDGRLDIDGGDKRSVCPGYNR